MDHRSIYWVTKRWTHDLERALLGRSTCPQCTLAPQPGTALSALAGSSGPAPTGNSASAPSCNSPPARWNTVASAPTGNSGEERSGTVGWERFGTLVAAPGAARSGNYLVGHSGKTLSAPSCTLALERWCKLAAAHSSIVAVEHCCSLCCIVAWGEQF